MEASGTSGMKAAMNGVINVSILDGWYDEGHDPNIGFSIGKGEAYDDPALQDAVESRALYDLLERQILPEFYHRDESSLPRKWIQRMKGSIRAYTPRFSTNRMVADYTEQFYLLAHGIERTLSAKDLAGARGLAAQINRLRQHWGEVAIRKVESNVTTSIPVRTPVRVRALVSLGGLQPGDVRVQLYHGEVTSLGDMLAGACVELHPLAEPAGDGTHTFEGEFAAAGSGRRGFTVRVVPRDERLVGTLVPGLITWYQQDDSGAKFEGGDASKYEATRQSGVMAVH